MAGPPGILVEFTCQGFMILSAGRGGPVARGRNIFPKEQHRGRGGRVNNLFKRFQAQHRDKLGEPEGDLLYDGFDTVTIEGREGKYVEGKPFERSTYLTYLHI